MKVMKIFLQSRDGVDWPEGWEGSKHMRTLAGFVVVAGRSHTTMFDIHGVGAFTQTSWSVWMSLSRASLIVGSFGAA